MMIRKAPTQTNTLGRQSPTTQSTRRDSPLQLRGDNRQLRLPLLQLCIYFCVRNPYVNGHIPQDTPPNHTIPTPSTNLHIYLRRRLLPVLLRQGQLPLQLLPPLPAPPGGQQRFWRRRGGSFGGGVGEERRGGVAAAVAPGGCYRGGGGGGGEVERRDFALQLGEALFVCMCVWCV